MNAGQMRSRDGSETEPSYRVAVEIDPDAPGRYRFSFHRSGPPAGNGGLVPLGHITTPPMSDVHAEELALAWLRIFHRVNPDTVDCLFVMPVYPRYYRLGYTGNGEPRPDGR